MRKLCNSIDTAGQDMLDLRTVNHLVNGLPNRKVMIIARLIAFQEAKDHATADKDITRCYAGFITAPAQHPHLLFPHLALGDVALCSPGYRGNACSFEPGIAPAGSYVYTGIGCNSLCSRLPDFFARFARTKEAAITWTTQRAKE